MFELEAPARSLGDAVFWCSASRQNPSRRGARVVDWDGLENRCAGNGTVGSNPTLSASSEQCWALPQPPRLRRCWRVAATGRTSIPCCEPCRRSPRPAAPARGDGHGDSRRLPAGCAGRVLDQSIFPKDQLVFLKKGAGGGFFRRQGPRNERLARPWPVRCVALAADRASHSGFWLASVSSRRALVSIRTRRAPHRQFL